MRNMNGFVAQTLVHTDRGSRPIGEIQVGDLVLSRVDDPKLSPPCGYKRVSQTLCFEEQPIIHFCWFRHDGKGGGEFGHVFGTPSTLVWSHPQGWLPMGRVPYTSAGGEQWWGRNLVMADGTAGERYEINSVYRTQKEPFAFLRSDEEGVFVDLSEAPHRFLGEHECQESWREDQDSDEWQIYTTRVCHLEVEEGHTFFVGMSGLLVHDAIRAAAEVPMNLIEVN